MGQAALVFVSWKAFSTYVRSSMLSRPTTYDTYWTIFMSDEASLWSTIRVAHDFMKRHDLHSRIAKVFIVLTMVFVLAFPTLASAMTGYTSKVGAFVQDRDQNLIQFSQYKLLAYIIHDGWRIGFSGNYPIVYQNATGKCPKTTTISGLVMLTRIIIHSRSPDLSRQLLLRRFRLSIPIQ